MVDESGKEVIEINAEEPVAGTVGVTEVEGKPEEIQTLPIQIATQADFFPLRFKNARKSILRTVCSDVTEFGEELQENVERLKKTLTKYGAYGLSAPQCNIPYRYFIINTDPVKGIQVMVNPKLVDCEEHVLSHEGCLSIPGINDKVIRFKNIHVEYYNEKGEKFEETFDGLTSVCIQHEMDHLIGILYVDRLSRLKRDMAWKKFNKRIKRQIREIEALKRQFGTEEFHRMIGVNA